MKKTIFTLASVVSLAGVANAQSLPIADFEGLLIGALDPTQNTTTTDNSFTTSSGAVNISTNGILTGSVTGPSTLTGSSGAPQGQYDLINYNNLVGSDQYIAFDFTSVSNLKNNSLYFHDWSNSTSFLLQLTDGNSGSLLSAGDIITTSSGINFADVAGGYINMTTTATTGTQSYNWISSSKGEISKASIFTRNSGPSADFVGVGAGNTHTVPEPSSTALLGLGALGLLVRRKR